MPRGVKKADTPIKPLPPAISEEGQESRMIALAMNLAEKQLLEGTASSQIINHYLKLGTEKEKLELEKLKMEKELLAAKTEYVRSEKNQEQMYREAIKAFQTYSGNGDEYYDE